MPSLLTVGSNEKGMLYVDIAFQHSSLLTVGSNEKGMLYVDIAFQHALSVNSWE